MNNDILPLLVPNVRIILTLSDPGLEEDFEPRVLCNFHSATYRTSLEVYQAWCLAHRLRHLRVQWSWHRRWGARA